MRITADCQTTIPRHVRKKLEIGLNTENEFREEDGRFYLNRKKMPGAKNKNRRFRGIATVRMTTDEIMALTRGEKRAA
ncbi:MAG TPA: AbrB/MazE/SpoVT family DNA-binding domain-containing protein [Desulfobacterales bacterium]|nr:MAG: AbrB/MazE/SpoVT family DNA-binding domain-containing protein [Deltaproteobacteria bacterium]HHC25011.1 AbrB/MazE/SpoVT family DNA-binding domain-containing protein [Desulfobacterales bacterium]